MGYGIGSVPALNYLACQTNANNAVVDTVSDVKRQSISYFGKLSEILAYSLSEMPLNKRPVSWYNLNHTVVIIKLYNYAHSHYPSFFSISFSYFRSFMADTVNLQFYHERRWSVFNLRKCQVDTQRSRVWLPPNYPQHIRLKPGQLASITSGRNAASFTPSLLEFYLGLHHIWTPKV